MATDGSALDYDSVIDCGHIAGEPPGTPINAMLNKPECSVNTPTVTAKFDFPGMKQ